MYNGHPHPGLFVSFEGPDGSGKSTQIMRLVEYMLTHGISKESLVQTREPGGTKVGERIRQVLLHDIEEEIEPYTELLLFEASRAQLVARCIKPALLERKLVLADRFFDSSTAYQGTAGKVPIDFVLSANRLASQGISPDRTYLFDVSYEVAQTRMRNGRHTAPPSQTMTDKPVEIDTRPGEDRIESKEKAYRERLRFGYLGLAQIEPDRFKVINTDRREPDDIFAEMLTDFAALCREKGYPLRTEDA